METATPSENPQWVLGTDDREYRRAQDYGEHVTPTFTLVDAATGTRKLIAKKHARRLHLVAGGPLSAGLRRQGLEHGFGSGRQESRTSPPALPVKFWNEETTRRARRGAYGNAGWTQGRQVRAALRPLRHLARRAGWLGREEHHRRLRPRARSAVPLRPRRRRIRASAGSTPPSRCCCARENLKTCDTGFFRGSLRRRRARSSSSWRAKNFTRAGEGQGRRRLPAHRADLQRSFPTWSPPTAASRNCAR